MPKVELQLSPIGDDSRVLVDGVDLAPGCRAVTVESRADHRTTVTLELNLHEITTIDSADAEVIIPDQTRDTLVALGWTPPAGS